jgi:hypothetical protein
MIICTALTAFVAFVTGTEKKSEGFFANKRRLAIVVGAILVTSIFLVLLFAHWLIKRKRKG